MAAGHERSADRAAQPSAQPGPGSVRPGAAQQRVAVGRRRVRADAAGACCPGAGHRSAQHRPRTCKPVPGRHARSRFGAEAGHARRHRQLAQAGATPRSRRLAPRARSAGTRLVRPLAEALRRGRIDTLRLTAPGDRGTLVVANRRSDRWKFWRKPYAFDALLKSTAPRRSPCRTPPRPPPRIPTDDPHPVPPCLAASPRPPRRCRPAPAARPPVCRTRHCPRRRARHQPQEPASAPKR